jgi:flagellar biosynthesis protein FlhB
MGKRFEILSVLLIYFLVASTHIFFLPVISSAASSATNSIFKRKIENSHSANHVERTDKAVVKETVKIASTILLLACLVALITGFRVKGPNIDSIPSSVRSFQNQRYLYLSFCVFRI